jgi:hypothetical protein
LSQGLHANRMNLRNCEERHGPPQHFLNTWMLSHVLPEHDHSVDGRSLSGGAGRASPGPVSGHHPPFPFKSPRDRMETKKQLQVQNPKSPSPKFPGRTRRFLLQSGLIIKRERARRRSLGTTHLTSPRRASSQGLLLRASGLRRRVSRCTRGIFGRLPPRPPPL